MNLLDFTTDPVDTFTKKEFDAMFDKFHQLVKLNVIPKDKFMKEMECIYDECSKNW